MLPLPGYDHLPHPGGATRGALQCLSGGGNQPVPQITPDGAAYFVSAGVVVPCTLGRRLERVAALPRRLRLQLTGASRAKNKRHSAGHAMTEVLRRILRGLWSPLQG